MGWFDEQLRARLKADKDAFTDAFEGIAGVFSKVERSRDDVSGAMGEISKFLHVPEGALMSRRVRLSPGWYEDASGVYLAKTKEGHNVALIPGWHGYSYKDYATGRTVRVNSRTNEGLEDEALCFYRPLPAEKLGVRDLVKFALRSISLSDVIYAAMITLFISLISTVSPFLMRIVYSEVIYSQDYGSLQAIFAFIILAGVSGIMFQIARELVTSRIQIKASVSVNAAVMMRLINLPAIFFRRFSAGELAQRATCSGMLCSTLANVAFSVGFTAIMSVIYLVQVFILSPVLVRPALWIAAALLASSVLVAWARSRVMNKAMNYRAKEYGLLYAFITGIQKIRLSGAERRAFAKWASQYKTASKLEYDPPILIKLSQVIPQAITLAGTFVLYFTAYNAGVAPEDYMAFTASFALLSGALSAFSVSATQAAMIAPMSDMLRPILEEVPEVSHGNPVEHLRGGIEINRVSFRYSEKTPMVLDNISFKIHSGEYVAIVGRSGCGKSTLMRLLLGFERPDNGVIYYDGNDIKTLDMKTVRARIGCVMQNSRLFPGSIYSNIVISAPELTEKDAWEAAEMAGIADDIRKMPMKMNTMISEGAGTLSGGQRQRIIIARAIAPRPRILLFDEATSALDNITQRIVSESLESLRCTRLVIAHRLSTVRHCGRILVIDGGKIAEEGSYDDLMERNGIFAGLVKRQQSGETEE
ncbi:MAG: ATP-binding cassette domain-containing protein [Synergistaceae bacterium]|nr:ATP-binding cassette domain-containing protein [Synergistaceae bacterium]